MAGDEIHLTISATRLENGAVKLKHGLVGDGYHIFEILGFIEIVKAELVKESQDLAKRLPDDKGEVRVHFTGKEKKRGKL